MVDGSVPRAMLPFMTATQQQYVCLELPVLHVQFGVIDCSYRGHAKSTITSCCIYPSTCQTVFKRRGLPDLRIKLYSITKSLLLSIAADENGHTASRSNSEAPSLAPMQCSDRKRKHGATTGLLRIKMK
ncbi:proline-, glutamic acid- and leucine-rich protein 1 [Melia azedarach]|uniref:Proline-, glutamic acid- and leucine-rich protein 1 n=1 Tax=Melia azedarach TaxID=155640 RepID=A0ACC1YC90_MELAZ|nr:proline-, glutamic acid- and leucine-rich protein 1 [Melia azedarach]